MAARFLPKRAINLNVARASSREFFSGHGLSSSNRVTSSCGFSSAFERAEGSNAVAETMEPGTGTEAMRDRPYETNQDKQGLNKATDDRPGGSTTSYVSEKAKEGVKTATEVAEKVGDTAKEAMDSVWKAAKEASKNTREAVAGDGNNDNDDAGQVQEDKAATEIKTVNQPVDTMEYRSVRELRKKAYDKTDSS